MKKIIAITTAAVMACSIFAGCGSEKTNDSNTSANKEDSSVVSTVDETKSTEDTSKSATSDSSEVKDNTDTQKTDSSATSSTEPDASADEPEQTDSEKGSAAALTVILTSIKEDYHPGTAGCSLVATELAGKLLDWNSECAIDDETLKTTVHDFFAALGNDDATTYVEQLNEVYYAAGTITGENAESALEAAGYEAEFYPWSAEDMYSLFTTIYEAIGVDMPADDNTAEAE